MDTSRPYNRGALSGTVLAERYRLGDRLGLGATGVVYHAEDLRLEREVAVKLLGRRLSEDPRVVARFEREAQAAARLTHPSICQVYDTGEDGGLHYIVMEYLAQPDLKQIIRSYAPLPPRKVLDLGAQVAEACEYAHAHGLVHLDLKPQNILFTDQGRVKVADFGLARALDEGGGTEEILGTVPYAAPERSRGADVHPSMDVYSLGVMLYECMTGRLPFQADTAEEVLAHQLRERPPSPRSLNPAIPSALEFIVMKALNREPARRYRSMAETLYDLRRVRSGEPLDQTGVLPRDESLHQLVAHRDEPPEEPTGSRGPAPRRRQIRGAWLAWSVTALVVLLVLFGVSKVVRALFWPQQLGPQVVVPNVLGMERAAAEQKLRECLLQVGEITEEESKDHQPGFVLKQSPSPAERSRVPKGTKVDLTVSIANQEVFVPDVTGKTLDEARLSLERGQLTLGKQEQKYDDTVPAGHIIKQLLRSGVRARQGDAVDVVVSQGPEPEPAVVPPPDATTPELSDPAAGAAETTEPYVKVALEPGVRLDPGISRFTVTVRARGKQEQQNLRVVKYDDDNRGGTELLNVVLAPTQSRSQSFTGRGLVTVKVFQDDQQVGDPWEFRPESERHSP